MEDSVDVEPKREERTSCYILRYLRKRKRALHRLAAATVSLPGRQVASCLPRVES